jgi:hypothetical protein
MRGAAGGRWGDHSLRRRCRRGIEPCSWPHCFAMFLYYASPILGPASGGFECS